MQEHVTEAIVLSKEPVRDLDARYSFFTKKFGKVTAKATSARKITSKLAGHLEPGTLTTIRFVDRNHGGIAQLVDALKLRHAGIAPAPLHSLNTMLAEWEPDEALWSELSAARGGEELFNWTPVLRILGWDPQDATCERCARGATTFFIPRQEFFCTACASKISRDALLLIQFAAHVGLQP